MLKHESKLVVANHAFTMSSNSTATAAIDATGFSRAVVETFWGPAEVTNAPAVLKLEEGDTTSSYSEVPYFVAGTSATNFTAATQSTATNATNAYKMDVDLRGRKPNLKLSITPPSGQGATALTASIVAHLYRDSQGVSGATAQGVNQVESH